MWGVLGLLLLRPWQNLEPLELYNSQIRIQRPQKIIERIVRPVSQKLFFVRLCNKC